jgi:hypothetical protein
MGRDVENLVMRYVQMDSHPREDHPTNIKNMVKAFIPNATVTEAPYFFQKAPDWFHAPANRWTIKMKDEYKTPVEVELLTRKRQIDVFAGAFETNEFFSQVSYINYSKQCSMQHAALQHWNKEAMLQRCIALSSRRCACSARARRN